MFQIIKNAFHWLFTKKGSTEVETVVIDITKVESANEFFPDDSGTNIPMPIVRKPRSNKYYDCGPIFDDSDYFFVDLLENGKVVGSIGLQNVEELNRIKKFWISGRYID